VNASLVYTDSVNNQTLETIELMEVAAKIIISNRDGIWVEVQRPMACANCNSSQGCQTDSLLGMAIATRLQLPAAEGFDAGDLVTLISPDGALLSAAFWAYGMPLLCMLGGAILGQSQVFSMAGSVAGAALGLIAGIGWLRCIRPASAQWQLVAATNRLPNACIQFIP
jgi:sigma-E factor negative regulatory protein RseC